MGILPLDRQVDITGGGHTKRTVRIKSSRPEISFNNSKTKTRLDMGTKNKYDDEYERGKSDAQSGRSMDRPCDEHAWTMFKSSSQKDDEYKSTRSYEAGYKDGDSSSDKGGCFVTTACVSSRNLPDDCFEMAMSRRLRDEYLSKFDEGKAFLQHYLEFAPSIVRNIQSRKDAEFVFDGIYFSVRECAELVSQGRFSDAFRIAKALVARLEKYRS